MHWLTYPLAGVIALLFLMQLIPLWQARRSLGQAAPDTTAVDGPASAEPRRVYYFHAPHCGPCRAMTPMVDRLRQAHPNLIKVNIAESLELARDFGVAVTPSFVLVEDGAIRRVMLGGQSERGLLKLLTGGAQ